MRRTFSKWVVATLLLGVATPGHAGAGMPRVDSWQVLPVDTLNAAIAAAAEAHQAWAHDPIQIALHEANALPAAVAERSDFSLTWKGDDVENPTSGVLVTTEEGLKDDSVTAVWTRFRMTRQADGSWRVAAWHVAYRCARGTAAKMRSFHRDLCP